MNQVSTVGLDLAKHIFQLHGGDSAGAVVFRKKLRRHPPCRDDTSIQSGPASQTCNRSLPDLI